MESLFINQEQAEKLGKQEIIVVGIPKAHFKKNEKGLEADLYLPNSNTLAYTNERKGRVKLDDMATLMNIPNKSANGLQAIKWFDEGKYKEIEEYCWQDVEVTESVYLKFKGYGFPKR